MGQMARTTHLPKRELINLLLLHLSQAKIRKAFNIANQIALDSRLESFRKVDLVALLLQEGGETRLTEAERKFPLYGAATIYLAILDKRPSFPALENMSVQLAKLQRNTGVIGKAGLAIRTVYLQGAGELILGNVFEIPLFYERKIEIVEPDPKSDDFGTKREEYTLERALVWIPRGLDYGIIVSRDFSAIRPILEFGRSKLGLEWILPRIPETMLKRIAAGGQARTATFHARQSEDADVQAITLSDPSLEEKRLFRTTINDASREQTSGFYLDHPGLTRGGLGISTNFSRIWTPVHLDRKGLVALGTSLIERVRSELIIEAAEDSSSFVSFYRNRPVSVGGKLLTGNARKQFDELATLLLRAQASDNKSARIQTDSLIGLLQERERLKLYDLLEFECPNCGTSVARSSTTHSPFKFLGLVDDVMTFQTDDGQFLTSENETFICECGQELEIAELVSQIRILPSIELIESIHAYLNNMANVTFGELFAIAGTSVNIFSKPANLRPREIRLDQLTKWRNIAHIHQIPLPTPRRKPTQVKRLQNVKEKCSRNGGHPSKDDCRLCLAQEITLARLRDQADICLPRILGLAIEEGFDGIHHRYEHADIKYTDRLLANGQRLSIGLHLKSREPRQPTLGMGRSKSKVKELITQLTYSAYVVSKGIYKFDVLGVSIPNDFAGDVREAIVHTALGLGFSVIILDFNQWSRIYDAARNTIQLQ